MNVWPIATTVAFGMFLMLVGCAPNESRPPEGEAKSTVIDKSPVPIHVPDGATSLIDLGAETVGYLDPKDLTEGIEIKKDDESIFASIQLLQGGTVNIAVPEDIRSAAVSKDRKYLAMLSGTDLVGAIDVIDLDAMQYIHRGSYVGDVSQWNDNSLSFSGVLLSGEGFTILHSVTIAEGMVSFGPEFVGSYHGYDQPDPMGEKYKKDEVDDTTLTLEKFQYTIKRLAKNFPYFERVGKYSALEKYTILDGESLRSLMEASIRAVDKTDVEFMRDAGMFFNYFYPFIHMATTRHILDPLVVDDYVKRFLEEVGIDPDLFPWLRESTT